MIDGTLVRLPVDDLVEYPNNPRRGDVAAIARSLEANGQFAPLVVQASGGVVLSGNHTLAAARSLGWTEVDAWVIDVDATHARRIVLAANRTSALGGYDSSALADLLSAAESDLDGTGYDLADLEDLLVSLEEDEPEPPAAPGASAPPTPGSAGQRMMILDLTVDGYLWVQDGFAEVCAILGVDTNIDAVVGLLRAELGLDAPPLPEDA